jgi:beta-aspartyl-dipeptidase (metallo-type)
MDVVDMELARWLSFYIENGGPLDKLTISSDADSATPDMFMRQLCELVVKHGYSVDFVLPLVTRNPATVLKLENKATLEVGCDADILLLDRGTLAVREVIAGGRRMVSDGSPVEHETFLEKSYRNIDLVGEKYHEMPD